MLKLLRNFALAGLLLAGIMKLLAWWAVGRDAERTVAALAPYAQIKYDGVSAGLDGTVTFDKVSVDAGHHVYRADSVVFEAPSLFWLLGHALIGGNSLPAQFGIAAEGLKLPPLPWLDPQMFDPATFVPFAAVGCGSGFSDSDYQRMGVAPGPTHEHLDYHYDADQHTLNLLLKLKAPDFSQVDIEADLKKYDPAGMVTAAMWDKAHVDQISATYTDADFLAKRNQFCAQRASGTTPAQFIERHISAVQDLLKQKRAEPSTELVQLYRTLLEHGGQASLLSLPSAGFVVAAFHGAPDELLRQLNVTARYQDKPPIMFRVAFAPPPEEPAPAEPALTLPATPAATAPTVATVPAATLKPPATVTTMPTPTAPPLAATPTKTAAPPVTTAPSAAVSTTTAAPSALAAPSVAPAKKTETTGIKTAHDDLGLHNLDRDEARLATVTPPLAAPSAKREIKPTSTPNARLGPSAESPPAGSLLGMVWKPSVFEALPESEQEAKNYELVDYPRLASMVGRYVQVLTEGGKKIGGLVLNVDDTGVKLQVNREGGNITFVVAKARIQEVRLPR